MVLAADALLSPILRLKTMVEFCGGFQLENKALHYLFLYWKIIGKAHNIWCRVVSGDKTLSEEEVKAAAKWFLCSRSPN